MTELPPNTPPELHGWDEIIKLADTDPISGKAAGANARATQKLVLAITNAHFGISALRGTIGHESRSLRGQIEQFNISTTELSKKANSLIKWYVILTAVVAGATLINAGIAIFVILSQ